MDRAKQIWEDYGENDAYFAVATFDDFRRGNLDDAAKERFFESGRSHVERIWSEFEGGFNVKLAPKRALDYGCGVGRVLIALAKRCDRVVGVDISSSMLAETAKNCAERSVSNVELSTTDEFIGASSAKYDFVHSFIVLQHVEPAIGLDMIRTILDRLETGGFGMLHVTFFDRTETFKKMRSRIYRDVPLVHRILSGLQGKKSPFMPIYEYDLNVVFRVLEENSCGECVVRFSDHGLLGALIFFRKENDDRALTKENGW